MQARIISSSNVYWGHNTPTRIAAWLQEQFHFEIEQLSYPTPLPEKSLFDFPGPVVWVYSLAADERIGNAISQLELNISLKYSSYISFRTSPFFNTLVVFELPSHHHQNWDLLMKENRAFNNFFPYYVDHNNFHQWEFEAKAWRRLDTSEQVVSPPSTVWTFFFEYLFIKNLLGT